MGGKSPKNAFNRLFHTLYLKYHSVGTVSVLLPVRLVCEFRRTAELTKLIGLAAAMASLEM